MLDLPVLMMSRLCHDMAASVTSLSYGRELLDDDSMRDSALELLDSGIVSIVSRLSFFRYAFGSPGLQSGEADMVEAASLIEGFCALTHVRVRHEFSGVCLSFPGMQLLMNMVLLASECLPRGGEVRIEVSGDRKNLCVCGGGEKLVISPHIGLALGGREPEGGWDARTIQPCFTAMLAEKLSMKIGLQRRADGVCIEASGKVCA